MDHIKICPHIKTEAGFAIGFVSDRYSGKNNIFQK